MLQPIRTLRDNPNVFELPNDRQREQRKKKKNQQSILTDTDEPNTDPVKLRLQKAGENLQEAQQAQKYENLDELLLDNPEKPKIDQERMQRNRNLSKKAALIQTLDALSGAASLQKNQDEAVVAPNRLQSVGLGALQNMQRLDEQQRIDLNRYNQRKEQVENQNRQITQQATQHNKNVDLQGAQMEYEQARQTYDQMLDEKEAKAIREDDQKEWHYEAGLRLITQRKFDEARAHFKEAGMKTETIDNIVEGGSSGESSLVAGVEIDPKSEALYEEYRHYNDQVSDDDFVTEYVSGQGDVVNYDKPKRGTAAWHADRIMDQMGDDFYLIDYAKRPEREASERERGDSQVQQASQRLQASPRIQNMNRQATITVQQQLADNMMKAPDRETAEQAAGQWLENARQMLLSDGVPENQVDGRAEQMFMAMMDDLRSGGQQESPESDPEGDRAGMIGGGQPAEESAAESEVAPEQPADEQPEPDRREDLPRHLRNTYDLGDKFLEQKRRMEQIRDINPNFDTTTGEREEQRIRQKLVEQLDRMPADQRQAVIAALGYDPYQEENDDE